VREERGMVGQEALLAAVEQSTDAVVITDATGRIQWVNPAFTAMTGYTREESFGAEPAHSQIRPPTPAIL
jgi:PAS domain S-box-containing protein